MSSDLSRAAALVSQTTPTPTPESPTAATSLTWEAVTAIATVAQAIVVIVAAIFAYYQVREANRTRRDAVALALIERLNDAEAGRRRRRIYAMSAKQVLRPSERELADMSQVANEFHALGFLLKRGVVDEATVLGLHYGAVTRAWSVLSPWIMEQRKRRGTLYAEYFEHLKDRAALYIAKERPAETPRAWRRR